MYGGWAVEPSGQYPANFTEIAEVVKAAADYHCEHCGMVFEEGTNKAKEVIRRDGKPMILTVHHIDGNKTNCGYHNLLSCCQRCHLRIQATWGPGDPLPNWMLNPPHWMVDRGLPYLPCPQAVLL